MYRGHITGEYAAGVTAEELGLAMLGSTSSEVAHG